MRRKQAKLLEYAIGFIFYGIILAVIVYFAIQLRQERIVNERVIKARIDSIIGKASNGDSKAQYILASIYSNPNSYGIRNSEKAWFWAKKAAKKGHVRAQTLLGTFYENEFGVEYDYEKMMMWYRRAAEAGYAHAQFLLASHLFPTRHIGNNESEAIRWYLAAARQGHSRAQHHLGVFVYYIREGDKQDLVKAHMWLSRAVKNSPDSESREASRTMLLSVEKAMRTRKLRQE